MKTLQELRDELRRAWPARSVSVRIEANYSRHTGTVETICFVYVMPAVKEPGEFIVNLHGPDPELLVALAVAQASDKETPIPATGEKGASSEG